MGHDEPMARAAGHGRKDIEDQLRGMQAKGMGDIPSVDRPTPRRGQWIYVAAGLVLAVVIVIVLVQVL